MMKIISYLLILCFFLTQSDIAFAFNNNAIPPALRTDKKLGGAASKASKDAGVSRRSFLGIDNLGAKPALQNQPQENQPSQQTMLPRSANRGALNITRREFISAFIWTIGAIVFAMGFWSTFIADIFNFKPQDLTDVHAGITVGKVDGAWRLFDHGKPMPIIAGMVCQPTEPGNHINVYTYNKYWGLSSLFQDMLDPKEGGKGYGKILFEMNKDRKYVLSMRVYELLSLAQDTDKIKKIFRRLYEQYGIRVLVGNNCGLWVPDPKWRQSQIQSPNDDPQIRKDVERMVQTYAREPWVLGWYIGNENDRYIIGGGFEQRINKTPEQYYKWMGELCQLVKDTQARFGVQRPVILGNSDFDPTGPSARMITELHKSGKVDILGVNIYLEPGQLQGRLESIKANMDMPVLLGEFGKSTFPEDDETQGEQARYLKAMWDVQKANFGANGAGNNIGGCVFEYSNEHWKGDATGFKSQEHFGIFYWHLDNPNEQNYSAWRYSLRPKPAQKVIFYTKLMPMFILGGLLLAHTLLAIPPLALLAIDAIAIGYVLYSYLPHIGLGQKFGSGLILETPPSPRERIAALEDFARDPMKLDKAINEIASLKLKKKKFDDNWLTSLYAIQGAISHAKLLKNDGASEKFIKDVYMELALKLSRQYAADGKMFPVAAVIVDENYNLVTLGWRYPYDNGADEIAYRNYHHAESSAITNLRRLVLEGKEPANKKYKLFVTLEPCIDCSKLIASQGFDEIIIGTLDPASSIRQANLNFLESSGVKISLPSERLQIQAAEFLPPLDDALIEHTVGLLGPQASAQDIGECVNQLRSNYEIALSGKNELTYLREKPTARELTGRVSQNLKLYDIKGHKREQTENDLIQLYWALHNYQPDETGRMPQVFVLLADAKLDKADISDEQAIAFYINEFMHKINPARPVVVLTVNNKNALYISEALVKTGLASASAVRDISWMGIFTYASIDDEIKISWLRKWDQGAFEKITQKDMDRTKTAKMIGPYFVNLLPFEEKLRQPAWADDEIDLNRPMDPSKFNFSKIKPNEILKQGVMLAGKPWDVIINAAPREEFASLVVPQQTTNQCLTKNDIEAFDEFVTRTQALVFYNSLWGGASVNSKHFQLSYSKPLAFELAKKDENMIWQETNGIAVGRIIGYPANIFCLKSADRKALVNETWRAIEYLQANNMPFDLAGMGDTVIIMPRGAEALSDIGGQPWAAYEIVGSGAGILDEEVYNNLTYNDIINSLRHATLPDVGFNALLSNLYPGAQLHAAVIPSILTMHEDELTIHCL